MTRFLRNLAGLLGFFLIWEGAVRAGLVDKLFLPPPSIVLARTVELLGQPSFVRDVVATVLAWAIALLISIGIAVPAGLLLGSIPWLRDATRAIVEFLRPIPSVALIPLVLLLIGSGPEAKITLAVYAAVWPILFNTIYALGEIDPVLTETAKSYGTSKTRMLTSVALPHAAPFVFTGPGIPRQDNPVHGGGVVTSGTLSPCLGVGIGMAYVPAERAQPGTGLEIDVRGKVRPAVVGTKPLYRKENDG